MSWINIRKAGTHFELYSQMEEQYGTGHHRITIQRKTTASSKCRGFCFYDSHPGFLTDRDITAHRCTERDCRFFLPKPQKINIIQK